MLTRVKNSIMAELAVWHLPLALLILTDSISSLVEVNFILKLNSCCANL